MYACLPYIQAVKTNNGYVCMYYSISGQNVYNGKLTCTYTCFFKMCFWEGGEVTCIAEALPYKCIYVEHVCVHVCLPYL